MRLKQRKNGYFYAYVRPKGSPKYLTGKSKGRFVYVPISLHTKNKDEAETKFRKLLARHPEDPIRQLKQIQNDKTLGEFQEYFLTWLQANRTTKSYKTHKNVLNQLVTHCGESLPIKQISYGHLEDLVTEWKSRTRTVKGSTRNLSVHTINSYIKHLKVAFTKARIRHFITENPFEGFPYEVTDKNTTVVLTKQQAKKFLNSIEDPIKRMLIYGYTITGLRRSEWLNLQWEDVDSPPDFIYIKKTKTKLSRHFPITSELRDLLNALGPKKSGRLFPAIHPDTVSHWVQKEAKKFNIDLHTHFLRHQYGTWKGQEGLSAFQIQKLLGHTHVTTSERYVHLPDDDMHKLAATGVIGVKLDTKIPEKQAIKSKHKLLNT